MFEQEIHYKTSAGREEIRQRCRELPQRLRIALVLIDGKTPWTLLKDQLNLLGDAEQIINQLSEMGLIESDHELPPASLFPTFQESRPARPE